MVDEDVGVAWLDALGLCVLPDGVRLEPVDGEFALGVRSFLLLDDDLESLALDNTLCLKPFIVIVLSEIEQWKW